MTVMTAEFRTTIYCDDCGADVYHLDGKPIPKRTVRLYAAQHLGWRHDPRHGDLCASCQPPQGPLDIQADRPERVLFR
jgi:hypothetical protein